MKIRLALLGLFVVFLTGFQSQSPQRFELNGRAQGTTYHITYYREDSLFLQKSIDSLLHEIDQSLSLYRKNSLINRWNDSRKGMRVDRHLENVVNKAMDVFNNTDGLFDITVFPLTKTWGFGPVKTEILPDSMAIRKIMPCIGTRNIYWKRGRLRKKKSCVQLDPNGIAQGYTVDMLATLLEQNGIQHYLVELGGEIRVKGQKFPSGEKMTIGIEAPGDDPWQPVINKVISMREGAVTTSGNYRRYRESGSNRISHLLDPHTGYSLQNELISVTVIARDAMTADAYDNALMGMGLQKAINFIESRPDLSAYFIYKKTDGRIADTMTRQFYTYLVR